MKIYYTSIFILVFFFASCKKEWLEKKPNKSLTVPETLSDFQALLDNPNIMNIEPILAEAGSDNYFITPGTLLSQDELTISTYLWATDGWKEKSLFDWIVPYKAIFYANRTIEGLKKIERNSFNVGEWNRLYGSALFYRAFAYYSLADIFAQPYVESNASTDLGIPLRLEANVAQIVGRNSVLDTYNQIINDLAESAVLLPQTQTYKSRPTKSGAYGMLARVFLAMGDYDKALIYSDSCLAIYNTLLDYNTLDSTLLISMPPYYENDEIIYYARMASSLIMNQARADIDSTLFQSYVSEDLRRVIFFRDRSGRNVWKGSYEGAANIYFCGLAVDEIYLIRAECHARNQNVSAAMQDLNTLLIKRWKSGQFTPLTAANASQALDIVLTERRKELLYRGLRWADLKRLNRDTRFSKTISRFYNGQTYQLTPNDKKFAWLIPDDEILYSGIEQNPR